jgi:hypothetical protein
MEENVQESVKPRVCDSMVLRPPAPHHLRYLLKIRCLVFTSVLLNQTLWGTEQGSCPVHLNGKMGKSKGRPVHGGIPARSGIIQSRQTEDAGQTLKPLKVKVHMLRVIFKSKKQNWN